MRYNKLSIAAAFLVATTLFSCNRGDDFYVSPNSPAITSPKALLPVIEVQTFSTFEGDLARSASILVQHNVGADGQATSTQVYTLQESQFDNQWQQIYSTLKNCQIMVDSFGTGRPYYAGIARVMMAMNLGLATDLWGDIPFTEALKGSLNYKPKYDSQEDVYKGILVILDSAISNLNQDVASNLALPGSDDYIYGGDVTNWAAAAHTLKARYMNRMSNKTTYNADAILAELALGISDESMNMMAIHGVTGNEQNQWFAFQDARFQYIVSSKTLVDEMLKRPTDTRVYYYFDSTGFGGVVGSPIDEPNVDVSILGSYLAGSSATPVPLVTYAEAKFIEAEASQRKSELADAALALNEAIQASCVQVTNGAYNGRDIATYTSSDVNLEKVMYEKWLAMYGQAEAFADYRRTKLPVLTPNPVGAITVIPERYPTPQSERVNNPNAPLVNIADPLWFAKP